MYHRTHVMSFLNMNKIMYLKNQFNLQNINFSMYIIENTKHRIE